MIKKFLLPIGRIPDDKIDDYVKSIVDKIKAGKVIAELQEILPTKNPNNMDRMEIYSRINGERQYQDMMYAERLDGIPDNEKPVAEWLNYIEFHLQKAKISNYTLQKEESLHELRKIAALAVAAMEIHGCPAREMKPCCGGDCKKTKDE